MYFVAFTCSTLCARVAGSTEFERAIREHTALDITYHHGGILKVAESLKHLPGSLTDHAATGRDHVFSVMRKHLLIRRMIGLVLIGIALNVFLYPHASMMQYVNRTFDSQVYMIILLVCGTWILAQPKTPLYGLLITPLAYHLYALIEYIPTLPDTNRTYINVPIYLFTLALAALTAYVES